MRAREGTASWRGSTPFTPSISPFDGRFDAGSGMATIRDPTPLRLGQYHTVRLFRNLTRGSLQVDGQPPVNGTSQVQGAGIPQLWGDLERLCSPPCARRANSKGWT